MILRTVLITFCLSLAACGGQSAIASSDRLEQVENDCSLLAANAELETGKTAPANFCFCMVQVLEEQPDVHLDAIGQTLAVVADEHRKSGNEFAEIVAKLHADADSPDASDRSVSLGIGVTLVEGLTEQIENRAQGGSC